MQQTQLSALDALERLKEGNQLYINAKQSCGDISPERRLYTSINGQAPYAVIVSCSDSRVIPECIFSAGIGDLFVIRVAGNVVDGFPLGSIEYAVEHLNCKLILVLGHTNCGAVGAALGKHSGYLQLIADEIKRAIGTEPDAVKASALNVRQTVSKLQTHLAKQKDVLVTGALYQTNSGVVDFLS